MNSDAIYEAWAPAGSVWSAWTKPVAFADLRAVSERDVSPEAAQPPAWTPPPSAGIAVILDVPGAHGVSLGFALAKAGYQCVPLYNGVAGPVTSAAAAVLDVEPVRQALASFAPEMSRLANPPAAPPVFLLDSRRLTGTGSANPGKFDNRWVVFPQDFPSANFLFAHGIRGVLVVLPPEGALADDLTHVLRRWQESGLSIRTVPTDGTRAADVQVPKPGRFRSLLYRALVLAGFRRNSAGGFGSLVPEPPQSGGYG